MLYLGGRNEKEITEKTVMYVKMNLLPLKRRELRREGREKKKGSVCETRNDKN